MPSFEQLWQEKYLPQFQAQQAREMEARDRAFLDLEYRLCGEPIRQLTAADLFLLQGLENPFVCGGEILPAHIAQVVWCQHARNIPARPIRTAWHRRRAFARLRNYPLEKAIEEVNHFIEAMTIDLAVGGGSSDGDRRPLLACFLAPLLVTVAKQIGAFDPATGEPLLSSPLPRLLQYRKAIAAELLGKDHKDYAPSDKLMVDCMEEVNQLNAAERAAAPTN